MISKRSNQGLTIIELLISMVLLGVLMTAILAPLTGLFQMTGQSAQTLDATTQAQEVMEAIQGQWRSYPPPQDPLNPSPQDERNVAALQASQNRYAQTCLRNLPTEREGLDVTYSVWSLDNNADQGAELPVRCGRADPNPPPMKRVRVTVTTNDPNNSASLTLDVPRP